MIDTNRFGIECGCGTMMLPNSHGKDKKEDDEKDEGRTTRQGIRCIWIDGLGFYV